MLRFRVADPADIGAICVLDHVVPLEAERSRFIARSVGSGDAYVVEENTDVIGYGVLDYSFFEQGFISMLYIHREHRQCGLGMALMQHMEMECRKSKLFTSTNVSNLPMQSLLAKVGYVLSGIVHNLDEGDPELIFYKAIRHA